MRAGMAFNHLSARTGTQSPGQMKNYRPEFESIVLGRQAGDLDREKIQILGSIIGEAYSEADRKGAGEKIRGIFQDFATTIANNIVKLASQRMRDVVRNVKEEHLREFLDVMHQEMLKSPERADAIPEAMLNTYLMSGGRLGAGAIAKVVRIGFSKSKTLCPKEASQNIQREYESGQLDSIREVAALREHVRADMISQDAAPVVFASGVYAANDNQVAGPLPEAVPIVHFLKAKNAEEGTQAERNYSQSVPEVVADNHKEKVRRRKEESKINEPLIRTSRTKPASVMEIPALGAEIAISHVRVREQKTDELKPKTEIKGATKEIRETGMMENKKAVEKKEWGKKTEEKSEIRTVTAPKIKGKRPLLRQENKERKMEKPKAPQAEKKHKKNGKKETKKPEFENRAKTKNGIIRDKVAAFKLRSEQIAKAGKKEKMKREKKTEITAGRQKIRNVKEPKDDKKITAGGKNKTAQKRRAGQKITELRAKPRQASCSLVFKKRPEIVRKAMPAARILPARKRGRRTEILFKFGF